MPPIGPSPRARPCAGEPRGGGGQGEAVRALLLAFLGVKQLWEILLKKLKVDNFNNPRNKIRPGLPGSFQLFWIYLRSSWI